MIFASSVFVKSGIPARRSLTGFCSTYFLWIFHVEPHDAYARVRTGVKTLTVQASLFVVVPVAALVLCAPGAPKPSWIV